MRLRILQKRVILRLMLSLIVTQSDAVQALVAHHEANIKHPIFGKEHAWQSRSSFSSYFWTVVWQVRLRLRLFVRTEALLAKLDAEGKHAELYVWPTRCDPTTSIENRDVAGTWEGSTDHPDVTIAEKISGYFNGRLYDTGSRRWSFGTVYCFHRIYQYGEAESSYVTYAAS